LLLVALDGLDFSHSSIFIQAEDGIRDKLVTGVQTCALPISSSACGWRVIELRWGRRLRAAFRRTGGTRLQQRLEAMPNAEYQRRSEERRVGKEWRIGWE